MDSPDAPDQNRPADAVVYTYDDLGRTVSVTREDGATTRYEYDVMDRLVRVVDPLGHATTRTYDGLGRMARATDAEGATTEWVYNARGEVVEIKGQAAGGAACGSGCAQASGFGGELGTYAYNDAGRLVAFTDRENRTTRFEYNHAGQHVRTIDARNFITEYAYDPAGNLLSITDPLGGTVTMAYNALNQVVRTDARVRELVETELGDGETIVDEVIRTLTTRYTYDVRGRLTAVDLPGGGRRETVYDARGRVARTRSRVQGGTWRETTYAYNARGDIVGVRTVGPDGTAEAVAFAVDAAGRVTETVADPDGAAVKARNEYDPVGRLAGTVDPLGGVTRLSYDAAGRLTGVTTPLGHETTFAYDKVGRRVEVADPTGRTVQTLYNPAGELARIDNGHTTVDFVYNRVGEVIRQTVSGRDPVRTTYDAGGNPVSVAQGDAETTFAYDPLGRMVMRTDPEGHTTRIVYDDLGRVTAGIDPLGETVRHAYDEAGRRASTTLPGGQTLTWTYDDEGKVVEADGGPRGRVRYEYDGLGRLTRVTDANDRTRETVYDPLGRVRQVRNEMGQPVSYEYDDAGRRISLTDANGNATLYEYDDDGRLQTMTYPNGDAEAYAYDDAGRLVRKTTPAGHVIEYAYDRAGQLAGVTFDGATVTYERDAAGAVTAVADPLTTMRYRYDTRGRLLEAHDSALAQRVRYAYDKRGLRTRMQAPGQTVNYGHDAAGRLTSVNASHYARAAEIGYDEDGRRTRMVLPNGIVTEYTYDKRGNLVDLVTYNPAEKGAARDGVEGEMLARFRYDLDPTGNRVGMHRYDYGAKAEEDIRYAFDEAYRLTGETRIDAMGRTVYEDAFTYDAVGNRLTRTSRGVPHGGVKPLNRDAQLKTVYVYNNANQLVRSVTTGGNGADASEVATDYSYDADGNLVRQSRTSPNADPHIITMEYDALGRQRLWSDGANEERTLYRGAAWHRWGTRVTSKQTPNASANRNPNANGNVTDHVPLVTQTTYYLYDGDNVVADFYGQPNRKYTLAKSYVSAGLDANISVTDHLGTNSNQGQGAAIGRSRGRGQNTETRFYSSDGLGSIRSLTNHQGIVTNTYDYTAFGESIPSYSHPTHGMDQRYSYTGRESSAFGTSGAPMFYRNRMYDPSIGRFTRRDPAGYLENPFGNLYNYVDGDPLSYIDPMGLSRWARFVNTVSRAADYSYAFTSSLAGEAAEVGGNVVDVVVETVKDPVGMANAAGVLYDESQQQMTERYTAVAERGGFGDALLVAAGDVIGATKFGEGIMGVDVQHAVSLDTGDRIWRSVEGGSQMILVGTAATVRATKISQSVSQGYKGTGISNVANKGREIKNWLSTAEIGGKHYGLTARAKMRIRIHKNIAESRRARQASNFTEHVKREKNFLSGLNSNDSNFIFDFDSMHGGSRMGFSNNNITQVVWPNNAKAMEKFLNIEGLVIADSLSTPGRCKTVWSLGKCKIIFERHPYHPHAPTWHKEFHWHLDTPGNLHQRFLPGDSMPGY